MAQDPQQLHALVHQKEVYKPPPNALGTAIYQDYDQITADVGRNMHYLLQINEHFNFDDRDSKRHIDPSFTLSKMRLFQTKEFSHLTMDNPWDKKITVIIASIKLRLHGVYNETGTIFPFWFAKYKKSFTL